MPSSEGYKNLIPIQDRPTEEQRAIQHKGGQANKARIEKEKEHQNEVRTFAEIAADLMQRMIKNEKTGELTSTKQVIMAGLIAKAAKGDTKAFDFVSKLLGEGIIDKLELTGANGEPLQSTVKYITPETLDEIKKHIADVIK